MDENVQKLQKDVSEVDVEAECLFFARQEVTLLQTLNQALKVVDPLFVLIRAFLQLVESDRARNGNREALTALLSSVPTLEKTEAAANSQECQTCGDYDGSEPVWFLISSSQLFFRTPFHEAHSKLEADQKQLELKVKKLQSTAKDKAPSIPHKGALADKIGPSLVQSLVTLKDNK